jgi:hypothetical protein
MAVAGDSFLPPENPGILPLTSQPITIDPKTEFYGSEERGGKEVESVGEVRYISGKKWWSRFQVWRSCATGAIGGEAARRSAVVFPSSPLCGRAFRILA